MFDEELEKLEDRFLYKCDEKELLSIFEENEKILTQDNKNLRALYLKQNILLELKEYSKLIELSDFVLTIDSNNMSSYCFKAEAMLEFEQYEDAIDTCRFVLNKEPLNYRAAWIWEEAYQRSGNELLPKPPKLPTPKGIIIERIVFLIIFIVYMGLNLIST